MIELDLHFSADGHLIVNHDPYMQPTTNVEEFEAIFGQRKKKRNLYIEDEDRYEEVDGYWWADFTLAEIKMLKRKQRYSSRQHASDSTFRVLTAEETIQNLLMLNENLPWKENDYPTGLYIEAKYYDFYLAEYNVDTVVMLHDLLKKYDLESIEKCEKKLPIIFQSLLWDAVVKSKQLMDIPTVYLTVNPLLDFASLKPYADAVGPDYFLLLDDNGDVSYPSAFVTEAHKHGLGVHPWTVADDHLKMAKNPILEHKIFNDWDVDFLFSEFPRTAVSTFDLYQRPSASKSKDAMD